MDFEILSLPMLGLALVVFGFAPAFLLRLIVLAFPKDDPRRAELRGELYHVPRFERPFWVMEQLEEALVEGLGQRLVWAATGRIIYRWHLGSGVRRNRQNPDTFFIPSEKERDAVAPGMEVKLTFEMRDGWGERMWVTVVGLKGRKLIGKLDNMPVGIPRLLAGDEIKFKREHIIDIWYAHEGKAELCPGQGTPEDPDPVITKGSYNGHDKHHEVAADGRFGHLPIEAPKPPTLPPPSPS
jgi:Uncharacterized protein conserved in bacteria (DUF2314)